MSEQERRPSCARTWEIAAVRDGRLSGHDSGSLARHLESCATCAAEQTELAELADSLRGLPRPSLDDLAARRIRQRVLMDHNAWLLRQHQPAPPRTHARPLLAATVVLALSAAGAWVLLGRRDTANRAHVTTPRVDIVASAGARFRQTTSPHTIVVTLDDGELHLAIRRDDPNDRVTIALPDGQIEDRGTVLDVSVASRQTQRLSVERGSVVLTLRASAPLTLGAGESWRREPEPVARAAASSSATQPAPVARHERPVSSSRAHAGANGVEPGPAPAADAAEAERAAKAEDDAYLRIVELAGAGRVQEARAAAKDYLVRFPNGFRRLEVLNIATRTSP